MAELADLHLQPRHGTDCALALSLMNVIISEGLYDKGFVERWTLGFEKLTGHVKHYSPEEVERITRIPSEAIRQFALTYASSKPACIIQGTNSLDQSSSGLQSGRAIAILQAITGNYEVPGGFIRAPRLRENPIEMPVQL